MDQLKSLWDNCRTVTYKAEIAEKLGINAAIILNRIVWSIQGHIDSNDQRFFKDGRWWMYDSLVDLKEYSKLGRYKILEAIKLLRENNLVETSQYEHSARNPRNWFSVNAENMIAYLGIPFVRKPDTSNGDESGNQTHMRLETRDICVWKPDSPSLLLRIETENLTLRNIECPVIEIKTKKPPIEEGKPLREKKMVKKTKPSLSDQQLELGRQWHEYAKANTKTKAYSSWNDGYFATALVKVAKATDLSSDALMGILGFLKGDDFWRPNALAPASLLNISKSNGKRKIDNILDSMERMSKPRRNAYDRPKSKDYSADNGKWEGIDDNNLWGDSPTVKKTS